MLPTDIPEDARGSGRICTMSKIFLDTNVLVYACDQDEPGKRDAARELLRNHDEHTSFCISTQILQEFYVAATRKLNIEPLKAKGIIYSFRHMETTMVDPEDINRAIDGNILWQVSFWDALVIVTAQKLNCKTLLTEDLNDGQMFDSVRVVNPFREHAN